jgi:hypothetical protein
VPEGPEECGDRTRKRAATAAIVQYVHETREVKKRCDKKAIREDRGSIK